jgi:hypothetical protein
MTRVRWTIWWPLVVALVPAGMFLLIGTGVRQPDGIPYQCPSAARQLVGGHALAIRPTVVEGEVRLYDPGDPTLVNPPGVWDRCRAKNSQAALIAALALLAGTGVTGIRALALSRRNRAGLPFETDSRTNPHARSDRTDPPRGKDAT